MTPPGVPPRKLPLRPTALALLGALAVGTDAAAGPRTVPPGGPASAAAVSPGAKLSELVGVPIAAMMTEQSIYLPCYAFTLLQGDAKDWNPGRSACFTLDKGETLQLAVPVHFPVTHGTSRVKKLRCYSYSDTAGDEVRYRASLLRGNVEIAGLDVVQKRGDDPEDTGSVHAANAELDPAKYHYDLAVTLQIVVPQGDGWLPKDNQFRGCRIDYTVMND